MGLHIRRGIGGTCPAKAAARRPALQALLKGLLGPCPAGPAPAPPASTPSAPSSPSTAEAPASRSHKVSNITAAATPLTLKTSSPNVIGADIVPGATQAAAVIATSPFPIPSQAALPTGASPGPTAGPQTPRITATNHGLPSNAATATNEASATAPTCIQAVISRVTNDVSATAPTGIQAMIPTATNGASAAPTAHIQVVTPTATADAAAEADLTARAGVKARGLKLTMPCSKPSSLAAPTTGAVPATVRVPSSCFHTSPEPQSTGMCTLSSVGRTATGVNVETSGVTAKPSLTAAVSQTDRQQTDSCSVRAGPTSCCCKGVVASAVHERGVTSHAPTDIAAVVGLLSSSQSEGGRKDKLCAAEAMSTQTDTREVDCASEGKEEEEQKAEPARSGLVIVTRIAACA